jgi:hypothetical protein
MIALLVLASIAAQGTEATNVSLHPPAPLVYFEAPDLERLLAAYDQAPMVQMARDPLVQDVFAKLQAALGIDFSRELKVGLETAAPSDRALVGAWESFRDLRSLSLSLDLAQGGPDELSQTLQRVTECAEEIRTIERALVESRNTHGSWPESISVLALDPKAVSDPWGRPYAYTLDGDEPRIVSLGADGESGGVGDDTDVSSGFALEDWTTAETKRRRSGILAVEAASPEQAVAILGRFVGSDELGQPRDVTIRGTPATVRSFHSAIENQDGWLLRWGSRAVLATEAVSLDAVIARAEGRADSVESFFLLKRLAACAGATPAGVDVVRVAVRPAGLKLLLDALPLDLGSPFFPSRAPSTEGTALRMRLVEQRFVTDIVAGGLTASWLESFGKQPVRASADGLAFVPADAAGVLATRLDVPTFRSELVRLLGLEEGETLAKLESEHGFDLRKDVLDNLAGGVVAYLMPPASIGVPNATLAFDVLDPVALEKGLGGLLAAAAANGAVIKSTKYKTVSLWTFVPPSGESSPVQVTPSVAVVGKRALVTTNSAWLRKEIKRELEPVAGEHHPLSRLENVPEDVTVIGSMDWGATISSVYKIARSALALGGMMELPFDTGAINAALPSTSEPFTRYVRPTIGWGRRVEGGYHARIESSFGPETWLSLAAFGFVAQQNIQRKLTEASAADVQAQEDAVDPSSSPGEAEVSAVEIGETRTTLSFLASRLAVYRIEHKRYPGRLPDLCQPTPNFPRGFIDSDALPLDGWKRALAYEVAAAGDSFRLWSMGPNGIDEKGVGDDVLAP